MYNRYNKKKNSIFIRFCNDLEKKNNLSKNNLSKSNDNLIF